MEIVTDSESVSEATGLDTEALDVAEAPLPDEVAPVKDEVTLEPAGEKTGDNSSDASPALEEAGNGDKPGADTTESKPRGTGAQKRINKLTGDKYALEKTNRELTAENEALRKGDIKPDVTDTIGKAPVQDDFEDYHDFVAENAKYEVRKERAEGDSKQKAGEATQALETEQHNISKQFIDRADKFRENKPDFDEVALGDDVPITAAMEQAILRSDIGPEIAYHLGSNPDEAKRIADMNPVDAIRELGNIEARLSLPPKKTLTKAPKTDKLLGGAEKVTKDLGDMSMKDYRNHRQKTG